MQLCLQILDSKVVTRKIFWNKDLAPIFGKVVPQDLDSKVVIRKILRNKELAMAMRESFGLNLFRISVRMISSLRFLLGG